MAVTAAAESSKPGSTACSAAHTDNAGLPLTRALSELQLHPTEAARVPPVAARSNKQPSDPQVL